MTDSGACENCGTAVVRHGQNWTHITGSLRCPGYWEGDGFAVLAEPCPNELGDAAHELRRRGYTEAAAIVDAL